MSSENGIKEAPKQPIAETEDEEHQTLTMVDVLEEEIRLEEDANAVLSGSDDRNCSYPFGYVSRQALYSCMTCITSERDPAGICLACSLECHDGHELVELYTKRNFACDCGNKKFPENFKCKLYPTKNELNSLNKYNQNFRGLYCECTRPYPDPEDDIEDEMIQCIICEDWLHGRHLGTIVPDDFEEMTCSNCLEKCDFLKYYHALSVPTGNNSLNDTSIKKESCSESSELMASSDNDKKLTSEQIMSKDQAQQENSEESNSQLITGKSVEDAKTDFGVLCKLDDLRKNDLPFNKGAIFWTTEWRKNLCKCNSCLVLYEKLNVAFLTSEGDSVHNYEENGKSKESGFQRGMQALSGMNRVQQVEMLHEYNDLQSELKDYLKKFHENGKVVREDDIKEFFEGLKSKKRQRVEIPLACK